MLSHSSQRPRAGPIALLLLLLLPCGAYGAECDLAPGVNSNEEVVLLISCNGTEFNVTVTVGDTYTNTTSNTVCFNETGEIVDGNDLLWDLQLQASGTQCSVAGCSGELDPALHSTNKQFATVSSSCFAEFPVGQHNYFNLNCVGPEISLRIEENSTATESEDNFYNEHFTYMYICYDSAGQEVGSNGFSVTTSRRRSVPNTFENGTECSFRGIYKYYIGGLLMTSSFEDVFCYPDHNECEEQDDTCPEDLICKNTLGSFECTCVNGYMITENGSSCEDENECMSLSHNCSLVEECVNTIGSFDCICRDGYNRSDGVLCTNHNECEENPCSGDNVICRDTPGSFECICKNGFIEDEIGSNCKDENECMSLTHNCSLVEECVNTIGSFDCICRDGYNRSDGVLCTDIDECTTGNNLCVQNATCENTEGSYYCNCTDGFVGNGTVECTEYVGPLRFILPGIVIMVTVIVVLAIASVIAVWFVRRNMRRKATNYHLHKHYLYIFGSHWKEPIDAAFEPVEIEHAFTSLSTSSSVATNIDHLWYENDISEVASLSPGTPNGISTTAQKDARKHTATAHATQSAREKGLTKAEEVPVLTQPHATKKTRTPNCEAEESRVGTAVPPVPAVARAGMSRTGYVSESVNSNTGYVGATTPEKNHSLTSSPATAPRSPTTAAVPLAPSVSQHLPSSGSNGYIQNGSPVATQQSGYVTDGTMTAASASAPLQNAVPVTAGAKEWNGSNKVSSSGYVSENNTSVSEKVEATVNSLSVAPSVQLSHTHPPSPPSNHQSSSSGYVQNISPATVRDGYTHSSTPPLVKSHDSGNPVPNSPPVTVQDGYIREPTLPSSSDTLLTETYDCDLPLSPPLIESHDSGCSRDYLQNSPPVTAQDGYVREPTLPTSSDSSSAKPLAPHHRSHLEDTVQDSYIHDSTISSEAKVWNDSNCVHEKVSSSGYVSENNSASEATVNSLTVAPSTQLSHMHPPTPPSNHQSSSSGYIQSSPPVTAQDGYIREPSLPTSLDSPFTETYDCDLPLSPPLTVSHDSGCLRESSPPVTAQDGYVHEPSLPTSSDSPFTEIYDCDLPLSPPLIESHDGGCLRDYIQNSPPVTVQDGYVREPTLPTSSDSPRTETYDCDLPLSPPLIESHDGGCLGDYVQNSPPVTVQDGYVREPTLPTSPRTETYGCDFPLSSPPPLIESHDGGCLRDYVQNSPPVTAQDGYVREPTLPVASDALIAESLGYAQKVDIPSPSLEPLDASGYIPHPAEPPTDLDCDEEGTASFRIDSSKRKGPDEMGAYIQGPTYAAPLHVDSHDTVDDHVDTPVLPPQEASGHDHTPPVSDATSLLEPQKNGAPVATVQGSGYVTAENPALPQHVPLKTELSPGNISPSSSGYVRADVMSNHHPESDGGYVHGSAFPNSSSSSTGSGYVPSFHIEDERTVFNSRPETSFNAHHQSSGYITTDFSPPGLPLSPASSTGYIGESFFPNSHNTTKASHGYV